MRRLILAALFMLAASGVARAACPAVLTDCPTINANAGNFGGTVTLNNWTTQNVTVLDPPIEARVNNWIITTNLTTGSTDNVTLPIVSQLNLNPGIYNYGTGGTGGQHNVAFYGYGRGANTLPLTGCTPGVNCPGTIQNAAGVMGFAEQHGTGEQFNAMSFEAHSPNVPPAGGWLDHWWVLYDDGCQSGVHATFCTGLAIGAQGRVTYSGFGATNPMAAVHARGNNKTATATGTINGTTLCLTSVPTNEIYPGATVTGTGVSAGTDVVGTASMSSTATPCYTVDVSQTVASTTLTFADTFVPFIAQNFTATGNSRYGFIAGNTGSAINAAIDGRNDTTRPLGPFLAFNVNNLDQAYVIPFGGARAGGMAIGYQNITTLPVQYSLTVGTAGLNVDGKYFTSGTQGATCSGPGVAFASLNGLVTGCPPPVSGVVPQQVTYTTTTAGVAFPAGTSYARIIVQGQGGCGGGGAGLTTPFTGAGGAAGGGSSPKDTGWFPLSQVSGTYSVTIGTPCTAAAGGGAGGTGANGAVGANATFSVTGLTNIVSYGGGGGAGAVGGAGTTTTGGGGGAGTETVGSSSTSGTGGGGGAIGGTAGGSGVAAAVNGNFYGASGGGGGGTGVGTPSGHTVSGSTGGGSGGGCNAGVAANGGAAAIPLSTTTTFGGGNAGGTTGVVGGTGPAAVGFTAAGGGGGGGSGTVSTGPGAAGGAGGGGGGGGASGCAAGVAGANGGVGGQAQVIVMAL